MTGLTRWVVGVAVLGLAAVVAPPASADGTGPAQITYVNVNRTVTPSDVGTWDPATQAAPSTRWFVLPGDQQGAGSYTFQTAKDPGGVGLLLSAPGTGDRIALATLPPAGLDFGASGRITFIGFNPKNGISPPSASALHAVFYDLECHGSDPAGVVRDGFWQGIPFPGGYGIPPGSGTDAVDKNVYADGSVGQGTGTPVLVAGKPYNRDTIAKYCPTVRDMGWEVSDGNSILYSSATVALARTYSSTSHTTVAKIEQDYFRPGSLGAPPVRLSGSDTIATSVQVAFKVAYKPKTVLLARSDLFADAAAATVLSKHLHAPLLLTPPSGLDPRIANYLHRYAAPGAHVYLLGGVGALSDRVAQQVKALGFLASRIAGPDRYATAAAIAEFMRVPTCGNDEQSLACGAVLVDGQSFGDALAALPLGGDAEPILYTRGDVLPWADAEYFKTSSSIGSIYTIGTPAAAAAKASEFSKYVYKSFAASDEYATAALVAAQRIPFGDYLRPVAVASGQYFADAVLGATMAPTVLTRNASLPAGSDSLLQHAAPTFEKVYLIDSGNALAAAVTAQIRTALGAGSGAAG